MNFDLDSLTIGEPDSSLVETNTLQRLTLDDDEVDQQRNSQSITQQDLLIDTDGDLIMRDSSQSAMDTLLNFTPSKGHMRQRFIQQHLPHVSSPLRNSTSTRSSASMVSDLLQEQMDVDNEEDIGSFNGDSSSMLGKSISETAGLILSPTLLGAKVATANSKALVLCGDNHRTEEDGESNGSEATGSSFSGSSGLSETGDYTSLGSTSKILDEETTQESEDSTQDEQISQTNNFTGSSSSSLEANTTCSSPNTSTARQQFHSMINTSLANNTPIQFQMHHHHHYYPATSTPQQQLNTLLPSPWSQQSHPKSPTPYVISTYLQLLFNTITASVALYALYALISTIRSDIDLRMEERTTELSIEIAQCKRSYFENRCSPETRAYALEEICTQWEKCMNRDPQALGGKSLVSAEMLGLILNSLVEPVGWKALLVYFFGVAVWSFGGNFMFGFFRAKSYYEGWGDRNDGNRLRLLQPVQNHLNSHYEEQPHLGYHVEEGSQDQDQDQAENHNWQLQ